MPRLSLEELAARVGASVVEEAWFGASAGYWIRRAEQLEAARSRPGDYRGQAWIAGLDSLDDYFDALLTAALRDARLTEAAAACRARATGADGWVTTTLAETAEDIAGGAAT